MDKPRHFEGMTFIGGQGYMPDHDEPYTEARMGKLDQQHLEKTITQGSWTYRELCVFFKADETQKMQIDRTLQKLRKANSIHFKRNGRTVTWYPGAAPEIPPGTGLV